MSGFICSMIGATFGVAAAAEVIRVKKSITAIGAAQVDTAQSKFGGASALFDGSNDWLDCVSSSGDFQFSTNLDYTIEGWFRFGSTASGNVIFSTYDSASVRTVIYFDTGEIWFYSPATSGQRTSQYPSTNTWYHMAIARSGNTTKIFFDGTSIFSTTTNINNNFTRLLLGTDDPSDGIPGYTGHIDEVRVSNVARYTANFTAPTAPFVNDENTLLLLHMDGTDGSTYFEDDNGVRSKIGVVALNGAQVDTAQSKFGGSSALFDGTNDYLSMNAATNTSLYVNTTSTSPFTLECWVRPQSTTKGAIITDEILNIGGGVGVAYCLGTAGSGVIGNVGGLYPWFGYFSGGWAGVTSTTALTANVWSHVAAVFTGSSSKIYINGTDVTSGTRSTWVTTAPNEILIGRRWDTDSNPYYYGWIDEVRISNVARYTANFTAPTAPFVNDDNTVLLLHCDGTDGSTYFEDDNGVRAQKELIVQGNCQIDTAQSKFGGSSMLTDGSNDALKTTGYNLTGDWTFEGWYRINTGTTEAILFRIHNSSNTFQANYGLYNRVIYTYQGGTTTGTTTLSTGVWYHLAFVRSGSTVSLYVNGTREATRAYSSPPNDAILYISGTQDAANLSLNGWSDEIRISSTARYSGTTYTVPTAPFQNDDDTVLLLHMDGTDALTVFKDDNGVTPNWTY